MSVCARSQPAIRQALKIYVCVTGIRNWSFLMLSIILARVQNGRTHWCQFLCVKLRSSHSGVFRSLGLLSTLMRANSRKMAKPLPPPEAGDGCIQYKWLKGYISQTYHSLVQAHYPFILLFYCSPSSLILIVPCSQTHISGVLMFTVFFLLYLGWLHLYRTMI